MSDLKDWWFLESDLGGKSTVAEVDGGTDAAVVVAFAVAVAARVENTVGVDCSVACYHYFCQEARIEELNDGVVEDSSGVLIHREMRPVSQQGVILRIFEV